MKVKVFHNPIKSFRIGLAVITLTAFTYAAQAQTQEEHSNANVRMGQKALLEGDFKNAASYLEKALPTEGKDPNVVYLLGYSQFQSGDYKKSIDTFNKVINLDPKNSSAYYYKAKANNSIAVNKDSKLSPSQREELLNAAIADYTKALAINANDAKLYQNRAVAYRDLGILLGTHGTDNYNKATSSQAYNKAVTDYEKVLTYDSSRKDIQTELKKAKVYRDNLK